MENESESHGELAIDKGNNPEYSNLDETLILVQRNNNTEESEEELENVLLQTTQNSVPCYLGRNGVTSL